MERTKKPKREKRFLLPLAAGIMVALALIVVVFIPGGVDGLDGTKDSGNVAAEADGTKDPGNVAAEADSTKDSGNVAAEAGGTKNSGSAVVEPDGEGNLVIYADRLSQDQVSFIRVSEGSRIELLARLGDDGTVKAALGTCQSCNGSPGAYYTQEGNELKCNNCGLTFPISVLDSPGGGCHPIMPADEILRYEGNDLAIDLDGLSAYEDLFSKVADH